MPSSLNKLLIEKELVELEPLPTEGGRNIIGTQVVESPISLIGDQEEAIQIAKSELESLFVLWYREGRDPRGKPLHFRFSGTIHQAIAKTKSYCEQMGYRWIRVDPFLTDLDASLKRHLS